MCKYRCVLLAVTLFIIRVNGGSTRGGYLASESATRLRIVAQPTEAGGRSNPKNVPTAPWSQIPDRLLYRDHMSKIDTGGSQPPGPAVSPATTIAHSGIVPSTAQQKEDDVVATSKASSPANGPLPYMHRNMRPAQTNPPAIRESSTTRKADQDERDRVLPNVLTQKESQPHTTSTAKTYPTAKTAHQGPVMLSLQPSPKVAGKNNQTDAPINHITNKATGKTPKIPNQHRSPVQTAVGLATSVSQNGAGSVGIDSHKPTTSTGNKALNTTVPQSSFKVGQEATIKSSGVPPTSSVTSTRTTASLVTAPVKALTVEPPYDEDNDGKSDEERVLNVETSLAGGSGKAKDGSVTKQQEDEKHSFQWDNMEESYRRTVPTQWQPQYSGGQPRAGVRKPPETAPVGPYPTAGEEDSHFFAYFLAATAVCVVAYLAFHNKRKIMALAIEGRGGRQRRHTVAYRRLDTADKDDHKGRAIF